MSLSAVSEVVASGSGTGGNGGDAKKKRCYPPEEISSSSSSSIGRPSDIDAEYDHDGDKEMNEVQSYGLNSLADLEDSLPIKKGLSTFYNGKSKSFLNLNGSPESGLKIKQVLKIDYPENKKRRLQIADSLKASKTSGTSLPILGSTNGENSSNSIMNGEEETSDDDELY